MEIDDTAHDLRQGDKYQGLPAADDDDLREAHVFPDSDTRHRDQPTIPDQDLVLQDIDTAYEILALTRAEVTESIWEVSSVLRPHHIEEMQALLADVQVLDRAQTIIQEILDPREESDESF